MLTRRSLLGAAAAATVRAAPRRPNIVLIMADDMGFSDIGCYGSEISTPNLDALAGQGIRFTRFANNARCCPTRAALLTGLYSHQTGVGGMVNDQKLPGYRGFLNDRCVTIAEALKPAGYRTLMAGKWHVGEDRPHWPTDRGFDRYFGLISGASNFFTLDPERKMALDGQPWRPSKPGYYMTDAFTDRALQFLAEPESRQRPFFLYLAYTSPHWPLHARDEDIARYKDRYHGGWDALRAERHQRMLKMGIVEERWGLSPRDPRIPAWKDAPDKEWQARRMAVYAAQIDRMDQNIGRIVKQVRDLGQEDNTLFLFLADNGGCAENIEIGFRGKQGTYKTLDGREVRLGNDPQIMPGPADTFQSYGIAWANASNTPFRRYKSWVHEGGIASPLVARWPGAIKQPGLLSHEPGHIIDIMATALDAAGAAYPATHAGRPITPLEGRSLLPVFRGGKRQPHNALFWEHMGNRAVRQDQWKLVAERGQPWELYDIEADRTERRNLAAERPELVRKLETVYDAWAKRAQVVPAPARGSGE
jgi:arylsulfatase